MSETLKKNILAKLMDIWVNNVYVDLDERWLFHDEGLIYNSRTHRLRNSIANDEKLKNVRIWFEIPYEYKDEVKRMRLDCLIVNMDDDDKDFAVTGIPKIKKTILFNIEATFDEKKQIYGDIEKLKEVSENMKDLPIQILVWITLD